MERSFSFSIADIKQALDLEDFDGLAAQMKMVPAERQSHREPAQPGSARLGGVLVLLYPYEEELRLVLTRRRDDLNSHPGQMSFPGGQREGRETLVMTALRETEEEIGVPAGTVEVLGKLTPLYIPPSDYEVHPFVAWAGQDGPPEFAPNPAEVAEIVEVPLSFLLDPACRGEQPWDVRGRRLIVPYYEIGEHKVWGATAMMISELAERLYAIPAQWQRES